MFGTVYAAQDTCQKIVKNNCKYPLLCFREYAMLLIVRCSKQLTESEKMKSSEIQSGRIYSWVVETDAKLLKGGRNGIAPNPFNDLTVTKRAVYAGQAATGETWVKAQLALNPTWEPSARPALHVATENPCVVKYVSTGELGVRIMNFRAIKREYFIAGKLATPAQLEIIAAYTPHRAKIENFVPVMFPYIHNVTNCDDDMTIAQVFRPVAIATRADKVTA